MILQGRARFENFNYLAKLLSSDKFAYAVATTDEASITTANFKDPIKFALSASNLRTYFTATYLSDIVVEFYKMHSKNHI